MTERRIILKFLFSVQRTRHENVSLTPSDNPILDSLMFRKDLQRQLGIARQFWLYLHNQGRYGKMDGRIRSST
jgi:hypothetical protein